MMNRAAKTYIIYTFLIIMLFVWWAMYRLDYQAAQIQQLQAQQTEILTKIHEVQQTQIVERELAGLQEVR